MLQSKLSNYNYIQYFEKLFLKYFNRDKKDKLELIYYSKNK